MNDFSNNASVPRPRGALEVSIQARAQERNRALMMAEFRADAEANREARVRRSGLIARLLSSIGLF